MAFGQDDPHGFAGDGEWNKPDHAIQARHPLASIGKFGDAEFAGGAGLRRVQYQFSRSAGGIGSTCPVSWAGLFMDFVGI